MSIKKEIKSEPDYKDNIIGGGMTKTTTVQNPYHQSPGPNAYALPTTVGYKNHDSSRWRYPAYSMGIKHLAIDKNIGPGPKYEIREQTRFGKASPPKYTMRPKVKDIGAFSNPGPGTYSPESCPIVKNNRPPIYSFGVKAYLTNKGIGPGPNAYNLPAAIGMRNHAIKTHPAYSMAIRLSTKTLERSPGPAAYSPPFLDAYKIRPPGLKIKDRTSGGSVANKPSPGPNAYNPQYNQRNSAPKFSFGIRHWERSPPYVTKEDNMC